MVNIILAPGQYIKSADRLSCDQIFHGTNVTIVSEFEDQPAEIMLNGGAFICNDGSFNQSSPFTSVNITNININGGYSPHYVGFILMFFGYPINVTLNNVNVYNCLNVPFLIEFQTSDNGTLSDQSYLTITNSTFNNNNGALFVLSIRSITVFIDNCTFDSNLKFGGFNFPTSTITITNSIFSNNQLAMELMFSCELEAQLTMDNSHSNYQPSEWTPPCCLSNVFNLTNVTVSGGLPTDDPFITLVGGNMTFDNVQMLNGQRLLNCPLTCKLLNGDYSCPTKRQLPKHLGWIIAGSVLGFIFVSFMALSIWRKVKMNRQQYQSIQ
ncbi:hypothetical protein SAMD00019534_020480 [Acytostelium subglobosum LB1]|uniref:hypothetical protein n=1 Tax=Acytostelium subglobosum LB1 TaxID=1410327 RepID=UPI000644D355|nr:hypothetical protein SAMD00019534_020480 [Acytostelium subglobosum LB1]GAM18873.1 hypothetical protein SAMD00019534_020480 [Acytostelium subglobosum LB1]|eukprot:XP_012758093.1 hypothetical protein SAMD00019534_020480 [Acytostelium subglobosum LB1]